MQKCQKGPYFGATTNKLLYALYTAISSLYMIFGDLEQTGGLVWRINTKIPKGSYLAVTITKPIYVLQIDIRSL